MSLLFFDGFETYATADILNNWTSKASTPTINATGGRRGGSGLSCGAGGYVRKTMLSSLSTIVIGFGFNPNNVSVIGAVYIARLLDVSSAQLELRINADATLSITRNGTVLGTSSASLNVGGWQYIELKVTIHDTTGSYELRLDGVNILSATSVDTKNTANASVNQVQIGLDGSVSGGPIYVFDDFYILDTAGSTNNNFLGDIRIDALYPTADGNYTAWTPSTGTDHYALVDEATPNTTDYNSSSTAGQKDSYVMSNPPALSSQAIYGVMVKVAALKDDAGSRSLKVGVRSGTTDSLSAAQALSTSQVYYSSIHEVDPATGLAWTVAAVDALETLVETA